jgi:hypothetical protein
MRVGKNDAKDALAIVAVGAAVGAAIGAIIVTAIHSAPAKPSTGGIAETRPAPEGAFSFCA